MLTAKIGIHANTINRLAEEGKIEPLEFTAPDGVRRKANSFAAAYDWLVMNGYRQDSPNIWPNPKHQVIWH